MTKLKSTVGIQPKLDKDFRKAQTFTWIQMYITGALLHLVCEKVTLLPG